VISKLERLSQTRRCPEAFAPFAGGRALSASSKRFRCQWRATDDVEGAACRVDRAALRSDAHALGQKSNKTFGLVTTAAGVHPPFPSPKPDTESQAQRKEWWRECMPVD